MNVAVEKGIASGNLSRSLDCLKEGIIMGKSCRPELATFVSEHHNQDLSDEINFDDEDQESLSNQYVSRQSRALKIQAVLEQSRRSRGPGKQSWRSRGLSEPGSFQEPGWYQSSSGSSDPRLMVVTDGPDPG